MTYEGLYINRSKVIREKSRGEGSLIEQDTIENVSLSIKNLNKRRLYIYFLTLFNATF